MSSYTIQVSTLIEQATQYDEGLSIKERIELGRQKLFSDIEYDIFDDAYRRTFETHFIRHFYTREIGFETEGLFKFKLETWLQINMPYFNKLFESELLEYDPLSNIDIHSDQDRTRESDGSNTQRSTQDTTGSNTTESNTVENSEAQSNASSNTESDSTQNTIAETESNQDNLRIHSDNPDSRLALTSSSGVIEYASELTENKTNDAGTTDSSTTSHTDSTTTSQDNTSADATSNTITTGNTTQGVIGSVTGENTGNEQEQVKQLRKGKDGTVTYQQMVKELRQTFIRIEQDIFDEMNKELFMLVY